MLCWKQTAGPDGHNLRVVQLSRDFLDVYISESEKTIFWIFIWSNNNKEENLKGPMLSWVHSF